METVDRSIARKASPLALAARLADVQARATGRLAKLAGTAAPTRSKLERDFRRLLREHVLPQPVSNGIVCGYEVDLHWPEHNLVAELDGYAHHDPRRAFESDRLRDQTLLVAGWRVARVTDRQLRETGAETGRFTVLLTGRRLRPGTPHRVRTTPPPGGLGPENSPKSRAGTPGC